jgi:hypothetical protein
METTNHDTTNEEPARLCGLERTERVGLENNLLDAEIHRNELGDRLQACLTEYREAQVMVRRARARLDRFDFLADVASTFGHEVAAVVEAHGVDG